MTADASTIRTWALELGFIACGIARPDPSIRAAELDRWLAAGYGGTMRYIHRQAKKRKDPRRIDEEARSIVVILDNYYYAEPEPETSGVKIAKYARGNDYHAVIETRLARLSERMLQDMNYKFSAGAREAFVRYITLRKSQPLFSNARSIRNALDRMRLRQASRLVADLDRVLTADDIQSLEAPDVLASRVFGNTGSV